MKRILIHILVHIEKYQLIIIGLLAIAWLICSDNQKLEPLITLFGAIFAAVALKKIVIKGNIDESISKTIARSHPINDWHTNEEFSEENAIAVYRKDPSIRIVRRREPLVRNFRERWLEGLYPDPSASSYYVSIEFNGNEILNLTILTVDGGRVYLPIPTTPTTLETNEFDLAICQILNGQTGYDTSYYFSQSKMILDKSKLEKH